jgi:superfamily II DNA or RNA helicase
VPDDLIEGLYETLVTDALRERIDAAREQGWLIDTDAIDGASLPAVLARYVHDEVQRSMTRVESPVSDKRSAQVEFTNRLLRLLRSAKPTEPSFDEAIDIAALILLEARRPLTTGTRLSTTRPGIPLSRSALLVNGHNDFQIGNEVAREIESADQIDLLCAFVRFAGLRLIRPQVQDFLLRGGRMRVIASVYTGSTERRALDELAGLGAKVKISYETSQTRLHAKAWLFHRDSGYHTAYVGSSNLTHSALLDGLEWNVRISQVDNAPIVDRVSATFEQYWNEPEFESYDPRVDAERLDQALNQQKGMTLVPEAFNISIEFGPKPFQQEMLEALAAERQRGHMRNLVVAPTGTGKTWVSAFDYKRLRSDGLDRLLFVAHRDEILQQSQQVFRYVLDDMSFGERHVGAERPAIGQHVFASIQSLHRTIDDVPADAYDVVIVDEFHHSEAPTYRKLLERLQPKVLLGLTATPERTDGQDIVHWFDNRIACDMRLWQALDQGLLSPFHYFGVHDGTDLRGVAFERGRYASGELEGIYTGDHLRARRILESVQEWALDPTKMRALGFCAGVAHAQFMADQFNAAGLPAVALHGGSPRDDRINAVRQLRRGELRAIFTVDIFNEGIDIPEVDTILLLRPTESATIFLQQLGRGLRWAEGKTVLTVLDFIGQSNAKYRFDLRYRAIMGGTRQQLRRMIESGFPLMPPGCAVRLDEIAQEIVLENVRSSLRLGRRELVDDLRGMPPDTTLSNFVAASNHELSDIYSSPGQTFMTLRRAAGHVREPAEQSELDAAKALARILHIDDEERYQQWSRYLAGEPLETDLTTREGRLNLMLFAALGLRGRPVSDLLSALSNFRKNPTLRNELAQLLEVLRDQARAETRPIDPRGVIPLHSHGTYGLYELIAAYGLVSKGLLRASREGLAWVPEQQTDLFFVTLNKSDEDYSPTTRYQDYPISPTLFHWESQSKTTVSSVTGRRYINHVALGSKIVLCVRENRKDGRGESAPYVCLGPARLVRHESEKPIRIVWELERPMPIEMFQSAKVAAG